MYNDRVTNEFLRKTTCMSWQLKPMTTHPQNHTHDSQAKDDTNSTTGYTSH